MINTEESIKDKLLKRGFWIYLFALITGPMGYFVKMIISNDITVEQVGVLYGIIGFIGILGAYHDLGLTESLNFFLPKFAVSKQYSKFKTIIAYAIIAQFVTSLVLGGMLFYGADWLWAHYFKSADAAYTLRVFCLFFLVNNFVSLFNTVFQALQETKMQNIIQFIRISSSLAFVFGLWTLDRGSIEWYAWTWIVSIVIAGIAGSFVFYKKYYKVYLSDVPLHLRDLTLFKTTFSYALWVLLTANVWVMLGQIDMQLILGILGPTDAGYYTNYLSLIGIPFIAFSPMIAFLFPIISSLDKEADAHKIGLLKATYSKLFLAIIPALSLYFILSGTDLAILFFGEKFATSWMILAWSAPFLIFNCLLQINFQLLWGLGMIKERLNVLIKGLIINTILNIVFIKLFWVAGSALAVGLSWIPIWYFSEQFVKQYSEKFDVRFFLKNLLVAGIVAFWIFYLRHLDWTEQFVRNRGFLLLWLSASGFFYIIAFALTNLHFVRMAKTEILRLKREPKPIS